MNLDWFAPIYKKHYNSLKCILVKRGVSEENAEDVINNTVISLLQNTELKQEGATALFTKSVQLNALKIGRKDKQTTALFEIGHYDTPEAAYMKKQDIITFYTCVEQLPKRAKECLLMKLDGNYMHVNKSNVKYGLTLLQKSMKLNSEVTKQSVAYATKGE